jgi:hypothetical protein
MRDDWPEGEDDEDRRLLSDIRRRGWAVVAVEESRHSPAYAFSAGLYYSFHHPEVLVLGLPASTSADMLSGRVGPRPRVREVLAVGNKSVGIGEALAHLRSRLGARAFDVVDAWPDDPDIIGIARPGSEEPCVCILTAGKEAGRYDVEYGDRVARECVMQGVEWVVRQELRPSRGRPASG